MNPNTQALIAVRHKKKQKNKNKTLSAFPDVVALMKSTQPFKREQETSLLE